MPEHVTDRWIAAWSETADEHLGRWSKRTRDPAGRWHCLSLSLAGTAEHPRYSAVFIRPETALPRQVQVHCRGTTDLRDVLDRPLAGYAARTVTACGSQEVGGLPLFVVVFDEDAGDAIVEHDLTIDELRAKCTQLADAGKILVSGTSWASIAPGSETVRQHFAAIWIANPKSWIRWTCTGIMDGPSFDDETEAYGKQWVVPCSVIWAGSGLVGVFSDGWLPGGVARFGQSDTWLATQIDQLDRALLPIQIDSAGIGDSVWHAFVAARVDRIVDRGPSTGPRPTPVARYRGVNRVFTARHARDYPDAASAIDEAVGDELRRRGGRTAALAVARAGDLVFAGGYTFAEEEVYPLTLPTSVFRIGSLSKVITAVAIHQLAEKGGFSLESRVADEIEDFDDPWAAELQVQHLLAHMGGLPKNVGTNVMPDDNAYNYDELVAGGRLPVTSDEFIAYLVRRNRLLRTRPGEVAFYSNTGYELLGEILRRRLRSVASSLEAIISEKVFRPLGFLADGEEGSPRRATTAWPDPDDPTGRRDEVRYHMSSLMNAGRSRATGIRKPVPWAYGGWHMERILGSAAWVMSAPHYLRMISRFSLRQAENPLLSAPTVDLFRMRTVLRDGASNPFTSGGLTASAHDGHDRWTKGGATTGSHSWTLFRSDGWSLVYLTSGGGELDTSRIEGWLELAAMKELPRPAGGGWTQFLPKL